MGETNCNQKVNRYIIRHVIGQLVLNGLYILSHLCLSNNRGQRGRVQCLMVMISHLHPNLYIKNKNPQTDLHIYIYICIYILIIYEKQSEKGNEKILKVDSTDNQRLLPVNVRVRLITELT